MQITKVTLCIFHLVGLGYPVIINVLCIIHANLQIHHDSISLDHSLNMLRSFIDTKIMNEKMTLELNMELSSTQISKMVHR